MPAIGEIVDLKHNHIGDDEIGKIVIVFFKL